MSLWKKVGGAFSTLSGAKTIKKQATYIKDDLKQFKTDLNFKGAPQQAKRRVDHWNEVVIANGITRKMLTGQYARRRVVAFLILLVMLLGLAVVVVSRDYVIGVPALVVATLLYVKNALRLYQIRHRDLCTFRYFLRAVRNTVSELLPRPLPTGWDVMAKEDVKHDVT